MSTHDEFSDARLEVLFDYASGLLSPEEAAAVEASLTEAERAEIDSQHLAMEMLTDAPEVRLSEVERAQLRSSVRSEAGPRATIRSSGLSFDWLKNWQAVAGVAAGFLLIAVAGSFVLNLGGDQLSSDDSAEVAVEAPAGDRVTATTAAPADGGADAFEAEEMQQDPMEEEFAADSGDLAMEEAQEMQAIEAPTGGLSDDQATVRSLSVITSDDAGRLLETEDSLRPLYNPEKLECRDQITEEVIDFGYAAKWQTQDGPDAVLFTITNEAGSRVVVYDVVTCDLIFLRTK